MAGLIAGTQRLHVLRRWTLTAAALVMLAVVTALLLQLIEAKTRQVASDHLLSGLDSVSSLLRVSVEEDLDRLEAVGSNPDITRAALEVLQHPDRRSAQDALAALISGGFQSRGFSGFSVITLDHRVVAASTPAYVGRPVRNPVNLSALDRAAREGRAISGPAPAPLPLSTRYGDLPTGTPFQLACQRLDQGSQPAGFLCLRNDPGQRLYRLLALARPGESGEAYLVSHDAMLLSPSRFERDFSEGLGNAPGWSAGRLRARVPSTTALPPFTGADAQAPVTQAMGLLQTRSDTGFLAGYRDYRNVAVVGAGRWLPELDVGLIVEQDEYEAFGANRIARQAVLALALAAAALIVLFSVVQQRIHARLQRSDTLTRTFGRNLPSGMALHDLEGRLMMANHVYDRMHGARPGSLIGRTHQDISPSDVARQADEEHRRVIATGQVCEVLRQMRGSDGHEGSFQVIRFPVRAMREGPVIGVGTVVSEVTELMRAKRELEVLNHELESRVAERTEELSSARDAAESASRAKAEFLANMSHEIRTPLNAIIGTSHLARQASREPGLQRYLQRIHTSAHHLLEVVNDILDFSRIEAGKLPIDAVEFSLEELLHHALGLVSERAHGKGLEILLRRQEGIPDRLIGDRLHLGQILINFLGNAVKFTEKGQVELGVTMVGVGGNAVRLRFTVRDTGIGIRPDALTRLFQPFQQLDGSPTRRFEGTGLGLSISSKLAELMGGIISATSTLDEGSEFALTLSLGLAAGAAAGIRPDIDLRHRRALVVDDNLSARTQLAEQLRLLSFDVEEAESGEQALERVLAADAAAHPFELLVIDAQMPGLGGREALQQLARATLLQPPPHRVLLTDDHLAAAEDPGAGVADACLPKPVSASLLFDTLIRLFDPGRHPSVGLPATTDPLVEASAEWLAGRRILLVEDNKINQEVASDLLQLAGAEVLLAQNGREALHVLDQESVDAVLLDMHMPVMDGLETVSRLRRDVRHAALPVIALTANAQDVDRDRCLAAGMSDYLRKPIDPMLMYDMLRRWTSGMTATAMAATDVSAGGPPPDVPAERTLREMRLFDALSGTPGLDLNLGIERMAGRRDLYLKLLTRFVRDRAGVAQAVLAAHAQGDAGEIHRLAHDMKSIAGTLGAWLLQEASEALADESLQGLPDETLCRSFATTYLSLIRHLGAIVADAPAGTGPAPTPPPIRS